MDDGRAYEFYLDPEHQTVAGPGRKRSRPRKTRMVTVRFDPAAIDAVRQLTEGSGMTISSWIRRLVDQEIAPPETVDFTLDDGTVVQFPAEAVRAVSSKLMPLIWQGRSASLTFGPVDEKERRDAAQATTAEVLKGWPVRPLDLVPGSGRMGASRSLPSSLNTNGGQGRTFSCQHMSIGNVVSAECWICGPLMAVA